MLAGIIHNVTVQKKETLPTEHETYVNVHSPSSKFDRFVSHLVFQGHTYSPPSNSPPQKGKEKKSPLEYIEICFPASQDFSNDSSPTYPPTFSCKSHLSTVTILKPAVPPKLLSESLSRLPYSSIGKANRIARRLSIFPNEEDGRQLVELLSTDPSIDSTLVFPAIFHLLSSSECFTRKAGYDLIVNTLLYCSDISNLDWSSCFSAMKCFGLESDLAAQESQLKALESLIQFQGRYTKPFQIIDCLIGWIWRDHKVIVADIDTLLRIDDLILGIINNDGDVEDFEVEAILHRYCTSLDNTMQKRSDYSELQIPLQVKASRFIAFLECSYKHHALSEACIVSCSKTLFKLFHYTNTPRTPTPSMIEGHTPMTPQTLHERATHQFYQLYDNKYHDLAISRAFKSCLMALDGCQDVNLAMGAICLLRKLFWRDFTRNSEGVWTDPSDPFLSPILRNVLPFLSSIPIVWKDHDGSEDIIYTLGLIVEEVVHHWRYGRASPLASFVGSCIMGFTGLIKEQLDKDAHSNLSLSDQGQAAKETGILQRLLHLPISTSVMDPSLDDILISMANHLSDETLAQIIERSKERWDLDIGLSQWINRLHLLLRLYRTQNRDLPNSRCAIMSYLSQLYEDVAVIDDFETDVTQLMISTLEESLPLECHQEVLISASNVLSKVMIISVSSGKPYWEKVCKIWEKLALQENSTTITRKLAITSLIVTFNRLAFKPPQSVTTEDANRDQTVETFKASKTLLRTLVYLVGLDCDGSGASKCPILPCPQSRLLILQWLLRLRVDAKHHIFAVKEQLPETLPMAKLAHRTADVDEAVEASNMEDAHLDERVRERRRQRIQVRRGTDPPSPVNIFHVESLSSSYQMLWRYPEVVNEELFDGTMVPYSAMTTFASHQNARGGNWLPISYYVRKICDILEIDTDWEIISYILCHFPLQLANKHLFCGDAVAGVIRRLVKVVCTAISQDRLHNNLKATIHRSIGPDNIRAMLYETLTMLVSYRRRFEFTGDHLEQESRALKTNIISSLVEGLGTTVISAKPSLQALSLIIFAMPKYLSNFTPKIVERLSRTMTNPDMAIYILEFLVTLGYYQVHHCGNSFRSVDYQRVFGVALMYIAHHYRPNGSTITTSDGRQSFSLAQHVLNTAFHVIYTWFFRIKFEDRSQYASYITSQLIGANRANSSLEPSTIVCLDWIARYTYGNADPKTCPTFMYRWIVCPEAPDNWQYSIRQDWTVKHNLELSNLERAAAFKLGDSIITMSTIKSRPGWIRLISRRPSCFVELICHVESERRGFRFKPVALASDDQPERENLLPDKETLITLLNEQFYDKYNVKDILRRDPVSGLAWDPSVDFPQPENEVIFPNMLAPLISPYSSHTTQQLQQFPDWRVLKSTLQLIDLCPVIDGHKAGVIYVAPGQKSEEDILSNRHGSPAYQRFLKKLGRLLNLSNELDVYMGGLNAKQHGEYGLGWWDDASQLIFHVATFMPNKDGNIWKKQEIGNDAVKVVWNDGGSPYHFDTIHSEYNLINIIIEPHTLVPQAAYEDDPHTTGFFKVIMQTRPGIPKVTAIGDFKIVSANNLPRLIRLSCILASLFCNAWVETGMDQGEPQKLVTSWQRRLELIRKTEKYLPKEEGDGKFTGT
ncbi:hypothetical protein CPB86DRAFT_810205 [Serendipita vermifera]|nr:hypothetical protein CPB86DRAFT_810205 [Serendipita vermifera]